MLSIFIVFSRCAIDLFLIYRSLFGSFTRIPRRSNIWILYGSFDLIICGSSALSYFMVPLFKSLQILSSKTFQTYIIAITLNIKVEKQSVDIH